MSQESGAGNVTAKPQLFQSWVEIASGPGQFIKIPVLTTTQRDALTNIRAGTMIWNSTTDREERYDGSNWIGIDTASLDDGAVTVAKLDSTLLGILLPVGSIDFTNIDYCKIG